MNIGLGRETTGAVTSTYAYGASPAAADGLAELPAVSDSSAPNYIALAGLAAAALLSLTASAWYARKRWLR